MKCILFFLFFLTFCEAARGQIDLRYPQVNFDSDTCCWRMLSRDHQYQAAGDLIVSYLKSNKHINRHSLNWHAGQLYAQADNKRMAVKYFGKTYNLFYRWFGGADGKSWYFYAKGTTAFVKRKKKRLSRYIHIWDRKLEKDRNYKQLVLLRDNWNKRYFEAVK